MSLLIKKLLLNALDDLRDKYGRAGCNDLHDGRGLFKDLSKEDTVKIRGKLEFQSDIELLGLIKEELSS